MCIVSVCSLGGRQVGSVHDLLNWKEILKQLTKKQQQTISFFHFPDLLRVRTVKLIHTVGVLTYQSLLARLVLISNSPKSFEL